MHKKILTASTLSCLMLWLVFGDRIDWTPVAVGAGIGVLSWLTHLLSDKSIGASSVYANVAGFLTRKLAPGQSLSFKYFRDHPPKIDWGTLFLVGAFAGASLSALSTGELCNDFLPATWIARFGPESHGLRFLAAFLGGAVMAFGARLAGGCTSGHGISGTMQLAPGSWLVFLSLFLSGATTAHILFEGVAL